MIKAEIIQPRLIFKTIIAKKRSTTKPVLSTVEVMTSVIKFRLKIILIEPSTPNITHNMFMTVYQAHPGITLLSTT